LIAVALLAVVGVTVYWAAIRDSTVAAKLAVPRATATIGSGSDAIAVGSDGQILAWLPLADDQPLPYLPLSSVPKGGQLGGPVLEQARVLGAAPAALRPYIESSYYGDSGVDVRLRSGIELLRRRFPGCCEVEGRRRGAGRPLDYRTRLCRPARATQARYRWLWAYPSASGMNPRPQG
jgi:hypothetical protein